MAGAEAVGQGPAAPVEEEPRGLAGVYRRAVDNVKSGNLGVLPIVIGLIFIVVFFGFKATNFFTPVNFVNILIQMAGTAMLAYGVVFVLLLGEIDLSISYVAGVGAVAVAELQLPGSGHQINGLLAMLAGIAICVAIGLGQGSIVARVGVPSFVVTLAGFLIWQGVILQRLAVPGSIIIQDRWVNYTASYGFSQTAGWIIAALVSVLYAVVVLGGIIGKRRAGVSIANPWMAVAKVIGVAVAAFGTVAICNHAVVQGTTLGLPLAGVLVVIFLVVLTFLAKRTTFGRHVYAVGGNAEAARRAGINVPRIRVLVFMISSGMAAVGGIILAANINSVSLQFGGGQLLLDSISAAVIGGVSLFGGRGEVRGAFLGALLLATVSNGLNTAGYASGIIYIVTGIILLLAVTLDTIARRLQVRSGR
jgi:D-xylose transport system permease protein